MIRRIFNYFFGRQPSTEALRQKQSALTLRLPTEVAHVEVAHAGQLQVRRKLSVSPVCGIRRRTE